MRSVIRSDSLSSLDSSSSILFESSAQTPLEGAQTSVLLAVDPELAKTSGEYFENCAPAASRYRSVYLADHRLADQMLRSSLGLLLEPHQLARLLHI
ncbi:hypothetical protein HPB50_011834 [Hyalomma asiaticum]|uniref:Uncharacterized protein n=1 Tax=Hyalomma asiaticum TaxID=266040 RepID=A0ACB7SUY7_HYAAI|nr:hypothetical protein HPB50_011834 [Hyalomma asiaticum]